MGAVAPTPVSLAIADELHRIFASRESIAPGYLELYAEDIPGMADSLAAAAEPQLGISHAEHMAMIPTHDVAAQVLDELRELRAELAPMVALFHQLQQVPRLAKQLRNLTPD